MVKNKKASDYSIIMWIVLGAALLVVMLLFYQKLYGSSGSIIESFFG